MKKECLFFCICLSISLCVAVICGCIFPIYHSFVFYSLIAMPICAYAAGISLYLTIKGNSTTNLSFKASLHNIVTITAGTLNKWACTGIYEQNSPLKNITGILKKEQ